MSKGKILALPDSIRLVEWIKKREPELRAKTSIEGAAIAKADLGIDISRDQLIRICRQMKIDLFTQTGRIQSGFSAGSTHDSLAVLAKAVRQIAEELGIRLYTIDQVNLIIQRKLNAVSDKSETGPQNQ